MINQEYEILLDKIESKEKSIKKMHKNKEKVNQELELIDEIKNQSLYRKDVIGNIIKFSVLDVIFLLLMCQSLTFGILCIPLSILTLVEVIAAKDCKMIIDDIKYNKSKDLKDLDLEEKKLNDKIKSIDSIIETYTNQYGELIDLKNQANKYIKYESTCKKLENNKVKTSEEKVILEDAYENRLELAKNYPMLAFDNYNELNDYNKLNEMDQKVLLKEKIYNK